VKRRRSQRDDVRAQIANGFYTKLEQLSADPDLLAVVGSWRDTLNDDEILAQCCTSRSESSVALRAASRCAIASF
jgi:hypothetical protein